MSIHKESKALFEGYDGPIYPKEIDNLNKTYYAIWDGKDGLRTILKIINEAIISMECFQGRMHAINTSDKYTWFESLRFLVPNGELMILLPRPRDWHRRSIAVYVKGTPRLSETEILIERIELRFYRIREKEVKEQLQKIISPK